jgi:hypothetical protein
MSDYSRQVTTVPMQRLSSPERWKRSIITLSLFAETQTIAPVAEVTKHDSVEAGAVIDTPRPWYSNVDRDHTLGVAVGFHTTGIGHVVLCRDWVEILVAGSMPHAWLGVDVFTWRKGVSEIMVGRIMQVSHAQVMVYGSMGMLLPVLRVPPLNGTFPFTLRIFRHKCQSFILGKVLKSVACWKTFT